MMILKSKRPHLGKKNEPLLLSQPDGSYGYCGSRIAWPLRWIANPVVSHREGSNPSCRAINRRNRPNHRLDHQRIYPLLSQVRTSNAVGFFDFDLLPLERQ